MSLCVRLNDNLCNINLTKKTLRRLRRLRRPEASYGLFTKIQTQLSVAQKVIALAMIGGDAELADGLTVFLRGIALVRQPVVLGIFLRQSVHIVVTIGLGEDRSGSNREILAVALNNRRMREILVFLKPVAIHDDCLRTHLQLIQRTMHRQYRGVEDVDLVDLLRGDDAHRPGHSIALDDLTQLVALLLRQLLRIVEQIVLSFSYAE